MFRHPDDSYIYDVDEHTFPRQVLGVSEQHPVLVDFWAEWCSPCTALTPNLERVVQEYGGSVLLAKVEVDDNMRLAGHYKLRGFPTVILFWRRDPLAHFSGNKPLHVIREWLEHELSAVEQG